MNECISSGIRVLAKLVLSKYEYVNDPTHTHKPLGAGWEETKEGWSRGKQEHTQIQNEGVKSLFGISNSQEDAGIFKDENVNKLFGIGDSPELEKAAEPKKGEEDSAEIGNAEKISKNEDGKSYSYDSEIAGFRKKIGNAEPNPGTFIPLCKDHLVLEMHELFKKVTENFGYNPHDCKSAEKAINAHTCGDFQSETNLNTKNKYALIVAEMNGHEPSGWFEKCLYGKPKSTGMGIKDRKKAMEEFEKVKRHAIEILRACGLIEKDKNGNDAIMLYRNSYTQAEMLKAGNKYSGSEFESWSFMPKDGMKALVPVERILSTVIGRSGNNAIPPYSFKYECEVTIDSVGLTGLILIEPEELGDEQKEFCLKMKKFAGDK